MNNYEMVYILPGTLPEDKIKELVSKIEGFITNHQGEITKSESWGMKKMAYPIKKCQMGNYFLVNFRMEPNSVLAVNQSLRIADEVVRFLVIRKIEKNLKKKNKRDKYFQKKNAAQKRPYEAAPNTAAPGIPPEEKKEAVPENKV